MRLLGKEIFLSLSLHAFLIATVFAVSTHINTETESVVVFLGADGGGSKAGGGGSLGQEKNNKKVASRSPQQRASTKSPAPDSSASTLPADDADQAKKKQEEQGKTVPSEREAKDVGEALQAATAGGTGDAGSAGSGGGSGGGAGTGSGRSEGNGFGTGKGTGSASGYGEGFGTGNAKNRYLRERFAYIRDLILRHLGYPPLAKKFGWMGSLTVSFVICENGSAELIHIVKSSGYEILDQNVVRTIKQLQPFPKPPVKAELVIPVMYRLQ